jgi:hypothetical protein
MRETQQTKPRKNNIRKERKKQTNCKQNHKQTDRQTDKHTHNKATQTSKHHKKTKQLV